MQIKNKFLSVIIVVILGLLIFACNKNEENQNPAIIPTVPVNFYIQPNTIDFIAAGSWKFYDQEGYRGVIIYRLDQHNFIAYERTCPYDPDKECAQVDIDPSSFTLIDSCCMSRYNIIDGSPVEGPAIEPLLQYFTDFDGNYLHVYN